MNISAGIVMATLAATAGHDTARPIHYESFQNGKEIYHAVVADMTRNEVTAATQYAGHLTKPWQLIGETQPAAAITGTFFGWKSQQPVADVVVDGKLVAQGHRGSAVGVDWLGNVHIFDTQFRKEIDWYAYRHLLRGAIRLVRDGNVRPDPQSQFFTDARLWGRAARTGVGITADQQLVLLATPNAVTLSQFGKAMTKLGVVDAVALDGGGSTMLYYRGKMVVSTQRPLCNLFLLHERPPR